MLPLAMWTARSRLPNAATRDVDGRDRLADGSPGDVDGYHRLWDGSTGDVGGCRRHLDDSPSDVDGCNLLPDGSLGDLGGCSLRPDGFRRHADGCGTGVRRSPSGVDGRRHRVGGCGAGVRRSPDEVNRPLLDGNRPRRRLNVSLRGGNRPFSGPHASFASRCVSDLPCNRPFPLAGRWREGVGCRDLKGGGCDAA